MSRYFLRITAIGSASGIRVVLLASLSLILARFLSLEDFGITRTVTAYMVVFSMLGHFCLHDAVAAYVASSRTSEEKALYVGNGSSLVLMIACIVTLVTELVIHSSGIWSGELKRTLSIVVLFLPSISLAIVYTTLLQAIGSYRKLTISLVLGGVVQLILVAPLSAQFGLSGWITGRAISYIILLVIGFWFISSLFKIVKLEKTATTNLLHFARLQFISGILSMVMQSADVIALERLTGDMTQVAVYALAALFGKSVLFLPAAVGRVYFNDIARSVGDEYHLWKGVSHLLLIATGLSAATAIAVFLFVPFAIKLMYGAKYVSSIPVLNVLCIGIIFGGIWSALSVINVAMKNPRAAVFISLTGVSAGLCLLYMLVPAFGAIGAAWGMNGAYAAGSVVGLWVVYKIRKGQYHKRATASRPS